MEWHSLTDAEKADRLASLFLAMHLRLKHLESCCDVDAIHGFTKVDVDMTAKAWQDYIGVRP